MSVETTTLKPEVRETLENIQDAVYSLGDAMRWLGNVEGERGNSGIEMILAALAKTASDVGEAIEAALDGRAHSIVSSCIPPAKPSTKTQ